MVRKIVPSDPSIGEFNAVTELMWDQIQEGTFEDTIVVFDWSDDPAGIALGYHEDADQFDHERVAEEGLVRCRTVSMGGGGAGVFTPATPSVVMFYKHDAYDPESNTLLRHFDELNGQSNQAAMEEIGLDAEYRSIGDTEAAVGGKQYKVMASAAGSFPHPEYWGFQSTPIWDSMPEDLGKLYNEVIDLPKEKFEDKDTDSLTSRMQPIKELLEEDGIDATKQDVINAIVEKNVENILGSDEPIVEKEWKPEEKEFIERTTPFYESTTWINRLSTSKLCMRAPSDCDVGIAAYKSRKLIKASVIVDDNGVIQDAQYTGDFFMRPLQTATTTREIDALSAALVGHDVTDESALEAAIMDVLKDSTIEVPRVSPSDLVNPVIKAGENTEPVKSYLSE
jgi:lipoate-protein ligase A